VFFARQSIDPVVANSESKKAPCSSSTFPYRMPATGALSVVDYIHVFIIKDMKCICRCRVACPYVTCVLMVS
jgi:hypothetical protein